MTNLFIIHTFECVLILFRVISHGVVIHARRGCGGKQHAVVVLVVERLHVVQIVQAELGHLAQNLEVAHHAQPNVKQKR